MVCVGRNYAAHALELNNKLPTSPMFFLKPATSVVYQPGPVVLPRGCGPQHEVEMAVEFGAAMHKVRGDSEAWGGVRGFRLACDVTARKWQAEAKAASLPWTKAKGANTFLPLGPLVEKSELVGGDAAAGGVGSVEIYAKVNGVTRQRAFLNEMVWTIPELIVHLTSFMRVEPGDLLLTGTPSGVGDLHGGDLLELGASHPAFGPPLKFKCEDEEA